MNTAKLESMINAGNYQDVNQHIRSFPVPDNVTLGFNPKVLHFFFELSTENVKIGINKKVHKPASLWDLLDFCAKNQKEGDRFGHSQNIVALDTVLLIDGEEFVAFVGENQFRQSNPQRALQLRKLNEPWTIGYHFLVVDK